MKAITVIILVFLIFTITFASGKSIDKIKDKDKIDKEKDKGSEVEEFYVSKKLKITPLFKNNTEVYESYNIIYKNITYKNKTKGVNTTFEYVNKTRTKFIYLEKNKVKIKDKDFIDYDYHLHCTTDGYCDSTLDGNGDGDCNAGETCCNLKDGVECFGHLAKRIEGSLLKVKIK